MKVENVILAVEDMLSEAISIKILNHFDIDIITVLRGDGKGYLQRRAPELNRSAIGIDIFLLTDLDSPKDCPLNLISSWVKGPINPRFLFRVAVMEVESWVLADRTSVARFLSIPVNRIPHDTDSISKPKEFLVSLARKSKKTRLREELVPNPGARIPVGSGYNSHLREFIREQWDMHRAALVSPSLNRTLGRLYQVRDVGSDQ